MGKCKCYRERLANKTFYTKSTVVPYSFTTTEGYCMGTKECDACSCEGDESRCTFYPEKIDNVHAELKYKTAALAVLGCRRNPQAHTTQECLECVFKNGMCDIYRLAEIAIKRDNELRVEYEHDSISTAVDGLIKFRHSYCKDYAKTEETGDLAFRCKDCHFSSIEGYCTIKEFIRDNGTDEQQDKAQVVSR